MQQSLFDDLKRFARDTEFHIKLRRAFEQRGAKVECLNFKFDDSPEGRFIETIIAAQGALEREQNGRQVRQKMEERIKRGYWTFNVPVGYKYAKCPEHGKILVRDEPKASIVQEALEGFASGRFSSQVEVLRFLEKQPAYPTDAKGKIHSQRVSDLLGQILYAGHIAFPAWDISTRRAKHEGLISLQTYNKIQQKRQDVAHVPARANINKDFVLRGAVCCADCNVPLRSCWSQGKTKKYAYYFCQNKECVSYGKSTARDKVEGAFVDYLKRLTPAQTVFRTAGRMLHDLWEQRLGQESANQQILREQLADTEKQARKLLDRIVATESNALVKSYEAKLVDLENTKLLLAEKLDTASQNRPALEDMLELSFAFLSNPCKVWEKAGYALRRTILKLVLTEPFVYCRINGPRTPKSTLPFKYLGRFSGAKVDMVEPRGVEPLTSCMPCKRSPN